MKDGPEPVGEVPIRLMLGALVAGAVVGIIAPVSDYERRRAVPARSDLTDRARRALNDFLDHAKSVLQETFAVAGESANKHGQQLATDVRQEFAVTSESSREQTKSPAW